MILDRIKVKPTEYNDNNMTCNGELLAELMTELVSVVKGKYEIPAWSSREQTLTSLKRQIKDLIPETRYYIEDGAAKWKSNNRCLFWDTVEELNIPVDKETHERIREIEVDKSLNDYRERMKNHVHTEEELFEMRNVFGEGTTVVNALTGKKIVL